MVKCLGKCGKEVWGCEVSAFTISINVKARLAVFLQENYVNN